MNWIKVEPNPIDNDVHPERLPAMEKVVHVIYVEGKDQAVALGGRVDSGEGLGWLWAINDVSQHWKSSEGYLVADDDYHVTHWAEIEWPED